MIGQLVDELYRLNRARSDDARLNHFRPALEHDAVSRMDRLRTIAYLSSVWQKSSINLSRPLAFVFPGAQRRAATTTGIQRRVQERILAWLFTCAALYRPGTVEMALRSRV